LHKTVKRVIADVDRFKFNTALAALMELTNAMARAWEQGGVDGATWREGVQSLLLLLAPIAPHITEELWERTCHPYSIHQQPLPTWDEALAADEVITLVVQVNGKVRDRLQAPADISEEEAKRLALASERVRSFTQGKRVERVVYVPGRLVSVVVR
jgi:leucyl-tRNA synthetase